MGIYILLIYCGTQICTQFGKGCTKLLPPPFIACQKLERTLVLLLSYCMFLFLAYCMCIDHAYGLKMA